MVRDGVFLGSSTRGGFQSFDCVFQKFFFFFISGGWVMQMTNFSSKGYFSNEIVSLAFVC